MLVRPRELGQMGGHREAVMAAPTQLGRDPGQLEYTALVRLR